MPSRASLPAFAAWNTGIPGTPEASAKGSLEIRIDHGPGYRIYYLPRGQTVILLCGGNKRRQRQDIKRAQMLAESL
jgi:putative addiction module killer protein